MALVVALTLGAGVMALSGSSSAAVTAVTGSAFGVSAPNISLFGGPQPAFGPTPSVTLPASGSATPVTATDPTENVAFGPATFLSSGPATATTQGTLASGSVTSSASVQAIAQPAGSCPGTQTACVYNGPFTADQVASTCTSAGGTNTATTTLTNGVLVTSTDPDGTHPVSQSVANPAVNLTINGVLFPSNTDRETFKYIFNEQIVNPDGSLTVNASHEFLFGPTAKGEVIIGHAVCGVTGVPSTTTTTTVPSTTTTTVPSTTTTTVPSTTTTTVPSTTTTTVPSTTTTTVPSTTTTTVPSTTTTTVAATTTTTVASTTTTTRPGTTTTTIDNDNRFHAICAVLARLQRSMHLPFIRVIIERLLDLFGCGSS